MASRKIEVQLVGDAGDLERSLAGALASLKAFGDGAKKGGKDNDTFTRSAKDAERGLIDFDRAASKVNKTMSGGPLGLFDAVGNVGYALLKLGGFAQDGEKALGDLASSGGKAEGVMDSLGTALSGFAPVLGVAVSGFAALAGALLILPALAAAATFVFVALLDTITILSAVVAAALGPLTLLAALLGGLGAAFVLSGKRALAGGGIFKDFAAQVEKVTGQFKDLIYTLGRDFLPLFERLATAASVALHYFNQLANMPLKQAFQSLATTGVAMLSKFLYGVGNVLKRPFKLAIQIAFGSGGANAQQAITSWWDSLIGYLFGYTKTHPIHIGSAIVLETKNIKGALDPIRRWFDRQHFVATGLRWAHEIIDGLVNAWNHDKGVRDAARAVLRDAGHMAGKAFAAAFRAEITNIPWRSLGMYILHQLDTSRQIQQAFSRIWPAIKSAAVSAFSAIKSAGSSAFHAVGSAANSVIGFVQGITSAVQTLISWIGHIHWPSVPSFHVPGIHIPGTAAGGTTIRSGLQLVGERGPEILNMPRGAQVIPLGRGGGATQVNLVLDRKVLASVLVDAEKTYRRQNAGRSLFAV